MILISSSLSSMPLYAMSMYLLPISTIKKMDTTIKSFFLARRKAEKEITPSQMGICFHWTIFQIEYMQCNMHGHQINYHDAELQCTSTTTTGNKQNPNVILFILS
jgi:hypothetical protein